jgi:PKHD-type hydroxylase
MQPVNSPYQSFVVWENAFTPAELDAIEGVGDSLKLEKAGVGYEDKSGSADDPIRATDIAWMARGAQSGWIYDRLQRIALALNEQIYQYDLVGFSDPFQYTVYRGAEGGHFGWHVDQEEKPLPRKLSFSLQLSHGNAYEGCDLELFGGSAREPLLAPRDRGLLIAFPSSVMHRVTPIRSGTRKALVFWTAGPKFR